MSARFLGIAHRSVYRVGLFAVTTMRVFYALEIDFGICSNAQKTMSVAGCSIPIRLSLDAT